MGKTTPHFELAKKELSLTEQEQFLYRMHLDNLYGTGGVDHEDGSRSSLYQTVEEHNGSYYNIPTVWKGKIETQTWVNDKGETFDIANKTALENVDKIGWDKFPSYKTGEEADTRYNTMHDYMDKDTSDYFSLGE